MSLSRFFRRNHWDAERAREVEAYLEIETADNVARGMTIEAARNAARRKLGNPTLIREEIYHMNTIGFIETVWRDLRYALRLLRNVRGLDAWRMSTKTEAKAAKPVQAVEDAIAMIMIY